MLWQLNCKKNTRECDGVKVTLDDPKGLGMFDVSPLLYARVASLNGQVATVAWGPLRTFAIDFAEGKVRYAESSDRLEGRGEASCEGTSE